MEIIPDGTSSNIGDERNMSEESLKQIRFSVDIIGFWLRGSISVDKHEIKTSVPNTLLGIIPLGRNTKQFTLRNVQGSSVNTNLNMGIFLVSIMFLGALIFEMFVGSTIEISKPFFIVGIIIGVLLFLGAILTSITISGNGDKHIIKVPFYERRKIIKINDAIQKTLQLQ